MVGAWGVDYLPTCGLRFLDHPAQSRPQAILELLGANGAAAERPLLPLHGYRREDDGATAVRVRDMREHVRGAIGRGTLCTFCTTSELRVQQRQPRAYGDSRQTQARES